jgi:pilus assembly protein CpaB
MRNAMILVMLLAVGLAGGTALLVRGYLSEAATRDDGPQQTQVLVAAQGLPAGTILNANHWRWQAWPDGNVDKSYVLRDRPGPGKPPAESQFLGAAVKRAIAAGEPITVARVVKPGETGFLAGALNPGMRALGIRVTAVSSASGFVLPGDRVDVILTHQLRERDGGEARTATVSETVLRDIRVLTIDQIADDVDKKAKVGKTATLEVSAKQAEVLSTAATIGNLSLSLRSFARRDGEDGSTGVTSDRDVSAAIAAGRDGASPAYDGPRTVRFYRGERRFELRFEGPDRIDRGEAGTGSR